MPGNNVDADMRRFMQSQQEAIANDPNYPLNDFSRQMKVGGIPVGEDRRRLEQNVMAVAEKFHNVRSSSSVLDEKNKVSPAVAQRSLSRQRQIVAQMKANDAAAHGRRVPPSQIKGRAPESQEQARLRANQVMQNIVTREEQALINQGISGGELGYVENMKRKRNDEPINFDDPVDLELTGSKPVESSQPGVFELPSKPTEDEFEDEM